MDSKKEIIPWTCHVCNKEFNVDCGGLCAKCHRPTCLKCLGVETFFGISKQAKPKNAVCRFCANAEELKVKEEFI